MRTTALLIFLLLATVVSAAKTDEKQIKPPGVPPWFATVGQLDRGKGTLVLYQTTVRFVTEEVVRNVTSNGKVEPNRQKITKPVYEQLSKLVSLKSATFAEASGKKIDATDIAKRLEVGMAVVVSADGNEIDSAYLKALAKDAIVIVDVGLARAEAPLFPPGVDWQAPPLRVSR